MKKLTPSQFMNYVFVFLFGVVISFLLIMQSPLVKTSQNSELHLEKLSLILESMHGELGEIKAQSQATNARINILENKIQAQEAVSTQLQEEVEQATNAEPVPEGSVQFPFVALSAQKGKTEMGTFTVTLIEGVGRVIVNDDPFVGTDVRTHARVAVEVAASIAKVNEEEYDFIIDFDAKDGLLESSSLGASMTLAVYAAFDELAVRPNVVITGSILSDGTIGPVGNLFDKVNGASDSLVEKFVLPKGQRRVTVYMDAEGELHSTYDETYDADILNLQDYARERSGMKVIEVEHILDAIPLFLD